MKAANPIIAEAISKGQDATGLCTVRELCEYLISERDRTRGTDAESLYSNMDTELFFTHNGKKINVYIKVLEEA